MVDNGEAALSNYEVAMVNQGILFNIKMHEIMHRLEKKDGFSANGGKGEASGKQDAYIGYK